MVTRLRARADRNVKLFSIDEFQQKKCIDADDPDRRGTLARMRGGRVAVIDVAETPERGACLRPEPVLRAASASSTVRTVANSPLVIPARDQVPETDSIADCEGSTLGTVTSTPEDALVVLHRSTIVGADGDALVFGVDGLD